MFRNLRFVYVTTKNREEAVQIGTKIVEEKLAACANILDGMESIYRWQGKIETSKETVLVLKTTYSNVAKLTKRVKALHSYEVPCVVSLNIAEQEGNPDYLNWIRDSVQIPLPQDENLRTD